MTDLDISRDCICYFNHHEQACAIAAEAYARIHNKIAALCVTTGPGGTNAITGVVGGWLDSIPMLVLSGQVRYDTTAHSTGLGIRAMGDQGIRDHKGDRLHDKVQRDGAGSDADPFLSGEIALSGADRKTGTVLARYSVECSGRLH
ncbi:MAG: thiamine pyrophosphate-binding protein [Pilosibacter sp.]